MHFLLRAVPVFMILVLHLLVSGCARIEVFDADDTSDNKGIKVYPPKPYIVAFTNEKGQREVRFVSLPDYTKGQYLKYKAGLGKFDFNYELENGVLAKFGQKSDAQAPETIESVTSGIGSIIGAILPAIAGAPAGVATAATDVATAAAFQPADVVKDTVKFPAVVSAYSAIQDKVIAPLSEEDVKDAFKILTLRISRHADSLLATSSFEMSGAAQANAAILAQEINEHRAKIRKALIPLLADANYLMEMADIPDIKKSGAGAVAIAAANALSKIVGEVQKTVLDVPSVELYELVGGEARLVGIF